MSSDNSIPKYVQMDRRFWLCGVFTAVGISGVSSVMIVKVGIRDGEQ